MGEGGKRVDKVRERGSSEVKITIRQTERPFCREEGSFRERDKHEGMND